MPGYQPVNDRERPSVPRMRGAEFDRLALLVARGRGLSEDLY